MHSAWLKGYTDKKARKEQVQSASWAFGLLEDVLEKEFKKKELPLDYSDPQWQYKAIAASEYNRALEDIRKLINVSGKDV